MSPYQPACFSVLGVPVAVTVEDGEVHGTTERRGEAISVRRTVSAPVHEATVNLHIPEAFSEGPRVNLVALLMRRPGGIVEPEFVYSASAMLSLPVDVRAGYVDPVTLSGEARRQGSRRTVERG